MNKTIVGELQSLIAMAQEAQVTDDFDTLEQMVVMMAPHWHKLIDSVQKARPEQDGWLMDSFAKSKFRVNVMPPEYRPVVTR